MVFIDRADGKRVKDLDAFQALLPYIMRGRNESAVYFGKDIDVDAAVRYVHRRNAESDDHRYSLFGVILTAAAQAFILKPKLNRFVHHRAVYQREKLTFSFIVKKRLTEGAQESSAKVYFPPDVTLTTATSAIERAVAFARGDQLSNDEKETVLAHRVPGGKRVASGVFRFLDRYNIAPKSMLEADPLFTSAFFANLGSIGLETPFHHLYEWGTASIFIVVGRLFQKEVRSQDGSVRKRSFVNIKVTLDERIADGLYFARAAAIFQRLILHPERLELPPSLMEPAESFAQSSRAKESCYG